MDSTLVLVLLATGILVGFAAGLFGIGGGFLMTPVQYWLFLESGMAQDVALLLAFGTNMAVVVPTALSSSYRHAKAGAVRWKTAILLGVVSAVATVGGAALATTLPAAILRPTFGAIVLIAALRMVFRTGVSAHESPRESLTPILLIALPTGFIAGLVGIGGGIIAVPLMMVILRFDMHHAVGTSAVMMIPIALFGALTYGYAGLGVAGLPPYSAGYVNLLNAVLLAGTSVPTAQLGASIAHRLPAERLRMLFAALMLYIGLRMIGVFELFNAL